MRRVSYAEKQMSPACHTHLKQYSGTPAIHFSTYESTP
jgi:hypothetical protein